MQSFCDVVDIRYNHCPDEKGTESLNISTAKLSRYCVTTIAPMKRGLKVPINIIIIAYIRRYNHCPDEKGTESCLKNGRPILYRNRYNHCPDEKGTESLAMADAGYASDRGYNHCPDEKGTERLQKSHPY